MCRRSNEPFYMNYMVCKSIHEKICYSQIFYFTVYVTKSDVIIIHHKGQFFIQCLNLP